MAQLSEDAMRETRDRMAGLSGSDARKTAQELCKSFGVSEGTIYRASASTRRLNIRSNRGIRKLPVENKVLEKMMAFTHRTDCPATDVVEIFEGNGLLKPGVMSPAWFTRWLKGRRMSRKEMKKDLRACIRFEASQPGEVYQIDPTLAEQYYIDDDGSVGWESTVSRNKNRPGNQKKRLVLFAAMDDHCRAVFAEFTTGQTVNHWLNFEFNAFRQKQDPRFIFHGIPWAIYMDNDSVSKNDKFIRAHKALGILVKKHEPTKKTDRFSKARSKGKIERFLGYLVQKQKRTKIKKFASLEEANRFLIEICLEYNLKKHSTTGETPFSRWNKIRPDMLVQCEDDRLYELLYRDIFERQVYRDMTVRFDGEIWQLDYKRPFVDMVNQRVTIYRHPLEKGKIYIEWEGREYMVERREAKVHNWINGPVRLPESEREKKIEEMEAADFSGLKLWGFDQGPDKDVVYLPVKKGIELDTSGITPEPPKMKRMHAMMGIAEKFGRPLTEKENEILAGLFGEWVTDEEIEQAIEQLVNLEIKTG